MVRPARRGALRIAALVLVVALPVGGALAYRWLLGLAGEFERLPVAVDFNAVRWNDCVAARWYARLAAGSYSTKRLFSRCRQAEDDLVDDIVRPVSRSKCIKSLDDAPIKPLDRVLDWE